MLLFVFIGFLGIASFIRYPDMQQAKALISTNPPPVRVFARSAGALSLLVAEGQKVKAGQALGYIQNPAQWQKVQALIRLLESDTFDEVQFILEEGNFEQGLGELQTYYEALLQICKERQFAKDYPINTYNRQSLEAMLSQKKQTRQNLQEKYQLDRSIFEQARKSYLIDSVLYTKKVKSTLEQYQSKSEYLRQQQSLKNSEAALLAHIEQVQDMKGRVGELNLRQGEESQKLSLALGQAYRNLQSQIALWQSRYALISPTKGKVNLLSYWADNQYITGEQAVVSIIPKAQTQAVKVFLPISGAGKVKVGQEVWLSIYDYPETEFGKIKGKITHISSLSQKQSGEEQAQYVLDVTLSHHNQTDLGKEIVLKPEMEGEAMIITEPHSLLSRILSPLYEVFDR
jgi:multidrug efflux pump subunit AcrA (membrane-fusion protein)